MKLPIRSTHPTGEELTPEKDKDLTTVAVDTYGGKIEVEWDETASVTALGQLPFFIEFLKTGFLFEPWVNECPLNYMSPNAPSKRDLLGTLLLSILAGHQRYAHVNSLRNDEVSPKLLGMTKLVSEDSLRRGLLKIDEDTGIDWLRNHLEYSYSPLLSEPWILDVDTTIKTIYGKQEGACVGYNPHKPGRPSHTYHTYMIANLRLVIDVDVYPGNESTSSHTAPNLWGLIDRMKGQQPSMLRGDSSFGTENIMLEAEKRQLAYLFKLKQTRNVQRLISTLSSRNEWTYAGQGWQGSESSLQLTGWSCHRRVIVLRRQLKEPVGMTKRSSIPKQMTLGFASVQKGQLYEYAVLVTSLKLAITGVSQLYRDRADCENNFDELKNQWGWCGYTTQDLKRCRFMARSIALVYNWWNLFTRMADPSKHQEAITTRPQLLNGVARKVTHARQTRLLITSHHSKATSVQKTLRRINDFLTKLKQYAEQLSPLETWYRILSYAFRKYLKGRILKPPDRLLSPA